jgi:hypothetical protein
MNQLTSSLELDWDRAKEAALRVVSHCAGAWFVPPEALDLHYGRIQDVCRELDLIVEALKISRIGPDGGEVSPPRSSRSASSEAEWVLVAGAPRESTVLSGRRVRGALIERGAGGEGPIVADIEFRDGGSGGSAGLAEGPLAYAWFFSSDERRPASARAAGYELAARAESMTTPGLVFGASVDAMPHGILVTIPGDRARRIVESYFGFEIPAVASTEDPEG